MLTEQQFDEAIFGSRLSPTDRLVALAYSYANPWRQGPFYVASARIEALTGFSDRAVRMATRSLIRAGFLSIAAEASQHQPRAFELHLPQKASRS